MPFPTPASNGQTYVAGGYVYTYNSTKKIWVKTGLAPTATVVVGNVTIAANTSTITVGNTTISANAISVSNTTITANAISVGNTSITANAITVGNTSITANAVTVGNTSITANAVTVGNTSITANAVTVGNTSITSNAITTGNTTITSGGITTGNTAITPNGITVGNTSITANSITTGNVVISNAGLTVGNTVISSNGSASFTSITSGSFVGNIFSSNVIENTNLFFTNARVFANVSLMSINDLNDVIYQTSNSQAVNFATVGAALAWNGYSWVPYDLANVATPAFVENANLACTVATISGFTTENLTEGANNLYYSNDRVYSNVILLLNNYVGNVTAAYFVGDGSRLTNISATAIANSISQIFGNTTSFSQNVVVNTAVVASIIAANIWQNLYTSNVRENGDTTTGNVYFSNTRARNALSSGQNISFDKSTGVISTSNNLLIDSLDAREGIFRGNLTVLGNLITISSNSTTVSESIIYLANGNTINDVIDIGFVGTYKDGGGVQRQTGLIRDASDGQYKLYQNGLYAVSSVVNTNDGGFRFASLTVDTLYGSVDWANITSKPDPVLTVNIEGDVVGNASTTLRDLTSNSITITTAIQPNSVQLGVDTFGQYVGNLIAGNGIAITNSGGENSSPTIAVANIDSIIVNSITNLGTSLTLTTSNIVEGVNLYYTNARVLSNVSSMSINVLTDVDITGVTAGNTLVWNGSKFIPGSSGVSSSTVVNQSNTANFAFTTNFANTAGTANTVLSISNFTTSNIAEGSNLYFTNTRAVAAVYNSTLGEVYVTNLTAGSFYYAGNLTVGNIVSTYGFIDLDNDQRNTIIQSGKWQYKFDDDGYLYVPNIIVTGAIFGNISGNISVGTLSQEQVQDFAAPLLLNGSHSGISFVYDDANNAIIATVTGSGGGGGSSDTANSALFASTANVANTVLSLNNFSTSNLVEGVNLYYTNARVLSNVSSMSINVLADVDLTNVVAGNVLKWDGTKFVPSSDNTGVSSVETANIANTVVSLSNFSTSNLREGSNLYFTNARVVSNVSQLSINTLADVDTTGTLHGYVFVWNGVNWSGIDPNIVIPNADHRYLKSDVIPAYNDTYYLGNVENVWASIFAGTVRANNFRDLSGNLFVPLQSGSSTVSNTSNIANVVLSLSNFTTSNLAEGSNLYFTNTRVFANIIPLLGLKANVSDLTTSNVIEGSNLYYTNARVLSNVSSMSINVLADVDLTNVVAGNVLKWDGTKFVPGSDLSGAAALDLTNLQSSIIPAYTDTYDLGNVNNLWRTIYAAEIKTSSFVNNDGTSFIPNVAKFANTSNIANVVLSLSNFTTSNLAEGSNLYYTNARVLNYVSNTNLPNITVANIRLSATGTISPSNDTNTIIRANTYDYVFGSTGFATFPNLVVNSNLSFNGNLIVTNNARIAGNLIPLVDGLYNLGSPTNRFKGLYIGGQTIDIGGGLFKFEDNKFKLQNSNGSPAQTEIYTGNIIEQGDTTTGNLFFTNTRARSAFANSTGVYYDVTNGIFSIGQDVATVSDVTFRNLTTTKDVTVQGNLYVQGDTVTLNTGTLAVEDKNILLANGAPNAAAADGAGITIEGAGATLTYFNSGDKWVFNKSLEVTGNITGSLITGETWAGLYSDNVNERNNLFYTNARVLSNVEFMSINVLADVDTTGLQNNYYLRWNGTKWVPGEVSATSASSDFANTALISNVANLANIANVVLSIDNFTTSNLAEGANLYFTNARSRASLSAGDDTIIYNPVTGTIRANISANVVSINGQEGYINLDTDDIPEGTSNLYYTNARVFANISPLLTTANVREVGNLYFTNARVFANISPLLTTANVREVGNLYFTNARVEAFVSNTTLSNITVANARVGNLLIGTSLLTTTFDSNTQIIAGNYTYTFNDVGVATFPGNVIAANYIGNITSLAGLSTTNLAEGTNLYYTNARVFSNVQPILNTKANVTDLTTSNVVERTNQYFTNARARLALSGGTGVNYNNTTGVVAIGQDVATSASVEFKNVLLTGNLTVQGTSTTLSARSVSISDNMIYLNEALEFAIVNAVGNGTSVTYTVAGANISSIIGEVVRITGMNPVAFNQASFVPITGVNANTFTISSSVTDSFISGGSAYIKSSVNPDLGWAGGYNDGTYRHAGVFRDATDGTFKVFEQYVPETDANVFIDTSHASFRFANIAVNKVFGDIEWANVLSKPDPVITVSLSGDVSGSANATLQDLTSNTVSITTVIQPNSVEMSVDTFGRYVGNILGGTGVVVTSSGAENAEPTIAVANIPNSALQNSTIIVNGTSISLGSSGNLTTSVIAEGSNLYYTNARVIAGVSQANVSNLTVTGNILASNVVANFFVGNGSQITGISTNLAGLATYGGNILASNIVVTGNISVGGNVVFGSGAFGATADNNTIIRAGIWDYTFGDQGSAIFPNLTVRSNLTLGNASSLSSNFDNNTLIVAGTSTYRFGDTGNLTLPGNIIFPGSTSIIGTSDNNTIITAGVFQSRFGDDGNVTLANLIVSGFLYGNGSRLTGLVSSISLTGLSTSNLLEGNNLYYTNDRVFSNVTLAITGKANVRDLTTANVSELNNLYFTNARVITGVTTANIANITVSGNILASNVVANFFVGNGALLSGITTGLTGMSTYGGNILASNIVVTGNLTVGGNLVFGSAAFGTTSDNNTIIKAGIWNYTFGDQGAAVFPNLTVQSNIVIGNTSSLSSNFDNNTLIVSGTSTYRFGDTGNLTLPGNIIFPGSTSIIGTSDNNTIITAGVFQSRFGDDGNVTMANVVVSGFLYGNGSRLTGLVSSISLTGLSTSNLLEGNNLYYTNARVIAGVSQANVSNLTVTGNIVAGNVNATRLSGIHIGDGSGLTGITTSIVIEGSNLYYTNARVITGVTTANIANITVSGNILASNVVANFFVGNGALLSGITTGLGGLATYGGNILASNIVVTGNLSIGGNLVIGNISSLSSNFDNNTLIVAGTSTYRFGDTGNLTLPGNIIFPGSTSIIGTSDNNTIITAGIFQSRFGDDGNVTMANVVVSGFLYGNGSRLTGIVTSTSSLANLAGLTTSNLAEGTNLYFTSARVRSNISSTTGVAGYNSTTGVITIPGTADHIAEGTANLFYTNARVIAGVALANIANITVSGNVSAGNVRATFFVGNGALLTGIATSLAGMATYGGNILASNIVVTGNLTVQGNINLGNTRIQTTPDNNTIITAGAYSFTFADTGVATFPGITVGNATVSSTLNVSSDNNTEIRAGIWTYKFTDTGDAILPNVRVQNAFTSNTGGALIRIASDSNTIIKAGVFESRFLDTGNVQLPNVVVSGKIYGDGSGLTNVIAASSASSAIDETIVRSRAILYSILMR